MSVKKHHYGVLGDGSEVSLWTVSNGKMSFSATDFGCLLVSVFLPSKTGGFDDVAMGYSTLDSWVHRNTSCQGALIGRYANRISGAKFTLDGKVYTLDANHLNKNSLHGGFMGYHKVMWKGEEFSCESGEGVRFSRRSPDGEQGYPGNLDVEVIYLLNKKNEIVLIYKAKTDKSTPVNLTQHIYFNLNGAGHPTVANHLAKINSKKILEVDSELIPTGGFINVAGTVFDFTSPCRLGEHFESETLKKMNGGFDCAYCFEPSKESDVAKLPVYAEITEPETGRALICRSNQPAMQLYTSCNLNAEFGKYARPYGKFSGFCLETARYTNAPNIQDFPSGILKPGETYESLTVYGFTW